MFMEKIKFITYKKIQLNFKFFMSIFNMKMNISVFFFVIVANYVIFHYILLF